MHAVTLVASRSCHTGLAAAASLKEAQTCTRVVPVEHRLERFIQAFTKLIDIAPTEAVILQRGGAFLAALVAQDDWLPDACAAAAATRYRQYLFLRLRTAYRAEFAVVSEVAETVWRPPAVGGAGCS